MKIFDLTNAKFVSINDSRIKQLFIDDVLIWESSYNSAIAGIAVAGIAIAGME